MGLLRRSRLLPFLAAALLACAPAAAAAPPPLVLISIDTLRADHLPAYGYADVATPAIDRLRRDAVLFRNTFSPVPMTLPAHSSMLTGLLPPEHGVRVNMGYDLASDRLPYVPRLLHDRGYATGAAVSTFVLRGGTGLARGFDLYDDQIGTHHALDPSVYERPGAQTLAAALPWLRSVKDRPFFLFFHLYEPHAPYDPPEPYRSRYKLRYDGEIARADELVGQLLDELRKLGLYDRAAIILTSDHGDGLGDHGEIGHGVLLYRSTLEVPLLLKLPAQASAGAEVISPTQLSDIAPTLLELAAASVPAAMSGRSLLGLLREPQGRNIYSETYYPRLYFGWSELRSLFDGRWQYIDSSQPELYDLTSDRAQDHNVLAEQRRLAAGLRNELATIPPRFAGPGELDLETRRKMESLGYIGGARSSYAGALPPPQSQMHLVQEISRGFAELGEEHYAEAAKAFERVVSENPHSIVAWENLAFCRERAGKLSEALVAYQEALQRSGNEPHLALAAGGVLLSLGRLPEAKAHAEIALHWNAPAARELLARIALAGGDLAEAERQAKAGLAEREGPGLLFALARVARQRGDLAGARDLARRAEAKSAGGSPPRGLYLLLGDVLARAGDPTGAEAAFRHEMQLFPDDPLAPTNLAMLLAATERQAEAAATLRQMVAARPSPGLYTIAIRTARALGADTLASELEREAKKRFPGFAAPAR